MNTTGMEHTKHSALPPDPWVDATAKAAFYRLLDRSHPRGPAVDAETRHVHRMCGAWLARRRLLLKVSNDDVANEVGLNKEALVLLENGLADEHMVSHDVQEGLGHLLAGDMYEREWVTAVIAVAVGRSGFAVDDVLRRVREDLQSVLASDDHTAVAPDPHSFLPVDPQKFQILLSLFLRERDSYGIMQEIKENTEGKILIGVLSIEGLLRQMLEEGLIVVAGERLDPDDDEPQPCYGMTDLGRHVTRLEIERIKDLERQIKPIIPWAERLSAHLSTV